MSLLAGTPSPPPLSPYLYFHFSARSYRTHYNPNRTRVNVTSWPPPPPQASCCPSSPPCAPTRSTLRRFAAACGTCSTCPSASSSSSCGSSSRYVHYRAALSVRIVATFPAFVAFFDCGLLQAGCALVVVWLSLHGGGETQSFARLHVTLPVSYAKCHTSSRRDIASCICCHERRHPSLADARRSKCDS